MMKEIKKLEHTFKFSVSSKSWPTKVSIMINGEQVFAKEYVAGQKTIENVMFNMDYFDQKLNNIKFIWKPAGDKEDGEKDLHIGKLLVHDQHIDQHNYEYNPDLNKDWWQSISDQEREKYLHVIHGSPSTNFGWHGEIDYYFVTLIDHSSRQLYNTCNENIRLLTGQSFDWVYFDQSCVNPKTRIYRKVSP